MLTRPFLVPLLALFAGAAVPLGCPVGPYPVTAFRCAPSGPAPNCPEGYRCCSDDPAAQDGGLPGYFGRAEGEVPIFSGINNALSSTGMCIDESALGGGLADPGVEGCPVPCNPQWTVEEVRTICGAGTICCQTVEIGSNDCVLDGGCWRPATGADIFDAGVQGSWGVGRDPWTPAAHDTHQDPGGAACQAFAAGAGDEALDACLAQLSVADQRGYCLGLSPTIQRCPLVSPAYFDACEQRNLQQGRDC